MKESAGERGTKGCPDLLGTTPEGRTIGVECKVRPNDLTTEQRWFLDEMRAHRGLALVVYDDVQQLVDAWKEREVR